MFVNDVTNVRCQIDTKYMVMLFTIGLGLILPLPLIFVEAVPRDPGFERSQDCTQKRDKNDKIISITCCWREPVPGQFLGKTYCQTCDANSANCGDKVAQSGTSGKLPDTVFQPNNEVVKENPLTQQHPLKSDNDPLIKDEITGEPLQFSTSNGENQKNTEFTDSGNSEEESNTQGNDNSDKSQELSDTNNSG